MIKLQKNPRHIISSKYRICCLKSAKLLLIVTDFMKVLVSSNRSLVELYHWKHIHSIPHTLYSMPKSWKIYVITFCPKTMLFRNTGNLVLQTCKMHENFHFLHIFFDLRMLGKRERRMICHPNFFSWSPVTIVYLTLMGEWPEWHLACKKPASWPLIRNRRRKSTPTQIHLESWPQIYKISYDLS